MAASIATFVCLIAGVFAATFDPYFPHELSAVETDLDGHYPLTGEDVVFIVRSQPTRPHIDWAKQVQADIHQQFRILNLGKSRVILLHEEYDVSGTWTILPLLPSLEEDFGGAKWVFFCEEQTRVSVHGLLQSLAKYDPDKEWFLGHALQDRSPTVIHHYRFHDNVSQFSYPDLEAGWLLSKALLARLSERWQSNEHKMDFSIDIKHELAFYIWDEGMGARLTHLPGLCAGNVQTNPKARTDDAIRRSLTEAVRGDPREEDGCITAHPKALPTCGDAVPKDKILIAIKTCQKFHKDRVPIVHRTWGSHATDKVFVSDIEDASIPTIASGIPNTERGHCGKLFAIFQMFDSKPEYAKYAWLVVADDDTILSVARLRQSLSCYSAEQMVFLGERYGYGHLKLGWGYDYLTGGGSMVFSRPGIRQLLASGCKCNKDDDPDDMILGMCSKRHDLPISHSPLFHQARPSDYASGFLRHQTPISFHKHLNSDPIAVYRDWFRTDDELDSRIHEAQGGREEL